MVRVSADSTCDLSPDLLQRFNVAITPLSITVGDQVFEMVLTYTPTMSFVLWMQEKPALRGPSMCTSTKNIFNG